MKHSYDTKVLSNEKEQANDKSNSEGALQNNREVI